MMKRVIIIVAAGLAIAAAGSIRAEVPLPPAWTPDLAVVPAGATAARLAAPVAAPATYAPEPQVLTRDDGTTGYRIKRVLPIQGPMRAGDWHWDEAGAPADGQVVITADLTAQTISVFRDGYEIGAAVILYGADDKPTPTGVFPITQKKVHHISNLYNVPMPYMQRLTNDGVAIHASEVSPDKATHGCIGVPREFAKKLFAVTKLGTKVIVTDGEMLQQGGAITALR